MTDEAMVEREITIVEGRSCDGCTMCCKLLKVKELGKPRLVWCVHCNIGVGCKIYEQRPEECRQFLCRYLLDEKIDEYWKPSKSKMVVAYEKDPKRIAIYVDPGRIDAWRKEPYYSQIKQWAVVAFEKQVQLIVWQGTDAIAVLPGKETNLGQVRDDQLIITVKKRGALGVEPDVMLFHKDDPSVQSFKKR